MRIALAQMYCPWGHVEDNIASMEIMTYRAKANGAHFIAFPELTVTGIFKDDKIWALAESMEGSIVKKVIDIAVETGLIIGFGFTESAIPLPYNAYAIALPSGTLAGIYRKNYIPQLEIPWWQGHTERPVFIIEDKRFAISICWDNNNSELLAHYGKEKVDVVLMPHAWDADPLDHQGKDLRYDTINELVDHHTTGRLAGWQTHDEMATQFYSYIPQQAKENSFYALFINQSGQPHPALLFDGPTFAVNPKGKVIAKTKNGLEQLVYVCIP